HVVGRLPAQVTNTVHRANDMALDDVRSRHERTFVQGGRPARVDAEHSTLRAGGAGEGLDERVLAASVAEAGREQIRNVAEVLDDPIRANPLEQLSTRTRTHIGEAQILAQRGVVLSDALAGL
ncbi:MAG: hypothetical protein ACK55Z_32130, partial [bacterium]